jgi:hypothetical protein
MTTVVVALAPMPTVDEWAARIRGHLARTVEGIIATGRDLIEAKRALPHGDWLPMLSQAGIGEDTADRFMRVARHPVLSNSAHVRNLPPSYGTLAELSRLPEADVVAAIDGGYVRPDTTRKDVVALTKARTKPWEGYDAGSVLIYFHGTEDEQFIKLGLTKRPSEFRRKEHERRGPRDEPMHFLAGVLGSTSDESSLKQYFKDLLADARTTEWMRAEPPLVEYVRWLTHQWYVAKSEAETEQLERVESTRWLPNPERVVPDPARLAYDPWESVKLPEVTGDDFYTDPRIIAAAREVMGGIDLDPASHPVANGTVCAERIFTIRDDGLSHEWKGRVWCNPPFGQWETWAAKIASEWRSGRVGEMCVLAATRSLTAQCFSPLLSGCSGACILHGRIPFWGPKAGSPDDGHAILYFGESFPRFAEVFSGLGNVFSLSRAYGQTVGAA